MSVKKFLTINIVTIIFACFTSYGVYIDWSSWQPLGLQSYSITCVIYSQKISKLICGTEQGLFTVDSKTGESKKIGEIQDSSIKDIEETKNGEIYVISGDKIFYCRLIDAQIPSYS